MSELYDTINNDLKKAMISKDHRQVSVLKMLKSAVLYSAVDSGSRDNISDDQVLTVLKKEAKKRREAAELYLQAGDQTRAEQEKYENKIIGAYLPEMLGEDQVLILVDNAIKKLGNDSKLIGKIISEVRTESQGLAEGSVIAKLVKERLDK